jgi:hypothetical protein
MSCTKPKSPGLRSPIQRQLQGEQPVLLRVEQLRFLQNVLLKTDSFYNDSKAGLQAQVRNVVDNKFLVTLMLVENEPGCN